MEPRHVDFVWNDIKLNSKLTRGKEYYVTVYNRYWIPTVQTRHMVYDIETRRGFDFPVWFLNKVKVPDTWEVTHWAEIPAPAWSEV